MTEPFDANDPHRFEPPSYAQPPYEPPPVTAPPSYPPYQPPAHPAPGYPPAPQPGGSPYPAQQPGYGWVGPDGAWVPLGAAPPATRRPTVLIVLAVVVLLVAAGVGGFFLVRSDDNGGSAKATPPPASFAGYTLLDNAAATRVKTAMRDVGHDMGGTAARVFDKASVGVYAHDSGDQPVLITLTVRTSDVGSDRTPDGVTAGMLSGATTNDQPFPAGRHGGSVRCGLAQFGAVSETMCAWSDSSRSGMLVSVTESKQPADLATLTQRFRDAVE